MAKMKTPSLSEVKEYFKDADKIQSIIGRKFKNDGKFRGSKYAMDGDTSIYAKNGKYEVWNQLKGYAKILSYKEPKEKTYKITREQILKYNMKDEFPEVIETKLTIGKWYKYESDSNFKYLVLYKGKGNACGFFCGKWEESLFFNTAKNRECTAIEATDQEVEDALIKEAVRRGFDKSWTKISIIDCKGEFFKSHTFCDSDVEFEYEKYGKNMFAKNGVVIFNNGKWAEIIDTLTPQQAEEKLKELGVNVKIV